MNHAEKIKLRLKENAKNLMKLDSLKGFECKTAFIFDDISMNFNKNTFENIKKNDNWKIRLNKRHSAFSNKNIYEMQSTNSSDALLMNIFCHPLFTKWKGPRKLLNIEKYDELSFGWKPYFTNEKSGHRTEIDLEINQCDIIVEAKLTEVDFKTKEMKVVERYVDFHNVFDINRLKIKNGKYENYQLIRNILTAKKYNSNFILMLDQTRTDLIREFYTTVGAVKDKNLASRLKFITWQELVETTGNSLKEYIEKKYF